MKNLEMYERFKEEIPGVELVGPYSDSKCFYLGFNNGKNLLAYDQFKCIPGYGKKQSDTAYRAMLIPMDGMDPLVGAFCDFVLEVSDSKHVYVIDGEENLLLDCEFIFNDNLDKFWKCVRRLGMKLKLMGLI
jgi:hypothetical protein